MSSFTSSARLMYPHTWPVFSIVAAGLGITVKGSWSARSAGRVVLEGALAAEEMIVEDFANALGRVIVLSGPVLAPNDFISVHPQC